MRRERFHYSLLLRRLVGVNEDAKNDWTLMTHEFSRLEMHGFKSSEHVNVSDCLALVIIQCAIFFVRTQSKRDVISRLLPVGLDIKTGECWSR